MMKNVVYLFCLVVFPIASWAQTTIAETPNRFRFVDVKLHSGSHYYSGQNLNTLLENGYGALEVRYGWSSKPNDEWAKGYHFPSYGIGWYSGYVGDVNVFGNPNAMYLFMDFPITRHKKNTLIIGPALGLTYNLLPYDPVKNAQNDAIGSKVTVYFNLNIGGILALNREVDFTYGLDFTHFSNGRTFTPNYGLNMLGLNIGMRYNFNRAQRKIDPSLHPITIVPSRPLYTEYRKHRKIKQHLIRLNQSVGTVQRESEKGTDLRYLTSSTMLEYQRQFTEMHAISVGLNAFFDGSLPDAVQSKSATAIHAGYHFMWWQFQIGFQLGTYLSNEMRTLKGNFFMRPSLTYQFGKHWYAQVGLKTLDGGAADWVEYGIGYRFAL